MNLVTPARLQDYSQVRLAETIVGLGEGSRAVVAQVVGVSRMCHTTPSAVEVHACSGVVLQSASLRKGCVPPRNRGHVGYTERLVRHGSLPEVFEGDGDVGFIRMISVLEGTGNGLVVSSPLSLSVVRLKSGAKVDSVNRPGAAGAVARKNGFRSVDEMFARIGRGVPVDDTWVDRDPDANEIDRALAEMEQRFGKGLEEVELEPDPLLFALR